MTQTAKPVTMLDRLSQHPCRVVIGGAVASTLLVNLGIWLLGAALGGTFQYLDHDVLHTTTAPQGVTTMTVVPMAAGLTLAVLAAVSWHAIEPLTRRLGSRLGSLVSSRRTVIRVAQVVGAIAPLAALFNTVAAGFDDMSIIALSAMHLVIAGLIPLSLEVLYRRISRQVGDGTRVPHLNGQAPPQIDE
jgi:hypothetical protein